MLPSLEGARKIDAIFSLHPALAQVGQMFADKQALAVQAIATAYRDRSHFDGQNVLETGGRQAYAEKSGWMNRLLSLLPGSDGKALALAADVPMALRGPLPVTSYAPSRLTAPANDLQARVARLYAGDQQLSGLWQRALATRSLVGTPDAESGKGSAELGRVAATLMTPANGARILIIETEGWDTHSAQAGRLAGQLRQLDALVGSLAQGLGPAWQQTLVLVATEFGRTAALNGTQGTDHGTASAALMMGGALQGGRVMADWPGLKQNDLHEARDLRPTMALESVISGAIAAHFGIDPVRTARTLYPAQADLRVVPV